MSTPTIQEELTFILSQLQWARMRFNEANAEWHCRYHDVQVLTQALIDHLQGIKHDDTTI